MGNAGSYISVHEAARVGHIKAVKKWVERGLSPNVKDNAGQTPLHHAAQGGQCEVTEYLIHSGADLNNRDSGGDSPLHVACYWGSIEVVKLLITAGASPNEKDYYGNVPNDIFDDNVPDATIEYIKMLFRDPDRIFKMPIALPKGSDAATEVERFTQHGVDVSTGGGDDNNASNMGLNSTMTDTEMEQIKQKLQITDVNSRLTPLNAECLSSTRELDRVYREENDRINLHAAARNGQNILINCALRNIDDSNPTCGGSSISSLEYDVDEKDSNGMTPLACTARFGRLSAAKCLLDHGANIEAQCGVRNWRPLHFATYYCHPAVVRVLVERGAETQAKDKCGMTPGRKYNYRCFLPFVGPSAKDRKMIAHILLGNSSMEEFNKFHHSMSATFPMNSPLEAYDVLVRPIVVGFPFFGHGKKERKSSKSSSSDQTTFSTSCKNSAGKGIRYYLERASLIQGAATGAVAQRVSLMMDKVAHPNILYTRTHS